MNQEIVIKKEEEMEQRSLMTISKMTSKEVVSQINLIQQVMKDAMKKNVHYGIIPGTNNLTLYKSGAEKLMLTFRLTAEYEIISETEMRDIYSYKVKCRLRHIATGKFVGDGIGACNSHERKYKTRAVPAKKATEQEKNEAIRFEKRTRQYEEYQVCIVPQEPEDLQNTLLKMACKRALVAAILNATAASDIFTQNVENIPQTMQSGTTVAKQDLAPKKKETEQNGESFPVAESEQQGVPETISTPQIKRIFAIAKGNGFDETQIKNVYTRYGYEHSKDILKKDYEVIMAEFQEPGATG